MPPPLATFSRNVLTLDPSGAQVARNAIRYDSGHDGAGGVYMPPINTPELVLTTTSGAVLATGVDSDGTTPVMVFYNQQQVRLFVFVGEFAPGSLPIDNSVSSYRSKQLDFVEPSQAARDGGVPAEFHDASQKYRTYALAVTGWTDKYILPSSAVVFHGLVVIAGAVLQKNASNTYDIAGFGFVRIDYSAGPPTFAVTPVWDDLAHSPQQFNLMRGQTWVLRAAPVYDRTTQPREVWLASTDYRAQEKNPDPLGGRLYLLKFVRVTMGLPWTFIPPTNGNCVIDDIPGGDDVSKGYCHAHSVHMLEYDEQPTGDKKVQLIVSLGDSQLQNRFVRYIHSNKDDPAYSQNWAKADPFHGRRTTGGVRGSWSCQPVAVAWGPKVKWDPSSPTEVARPTLIWGTDLETEWLLQMFPSLPGDAADQARFKHAYGYGTCFGSVFSGAFKRPLPLVFTLNESNPGVAGPLVAVLNIDPQDTRWLTRVLYCPSASTPDVWMQVASVFGTSTGTAGLFGSHIYFVAFGATDAGGAGYGLRRVPVPATPPKYQPALISAGGKNLLLANCHYDKGDWAPGATDVQQLTQVPGQPRVFKDVLDGGAGEVVLPRLPSYADRVFRFRTSAGTPVPTSDRFIAQLHLSGGSTSEWDQSPAWWIKDGIARVRRFTAWMLDGSYNKGAPQPNKTIQLGSRPQDALQPPTVSGASTLCSSANRWSPLTVITALPMGAGADRGPNLRFFPDYGSNDSSADDNYGYFAIGGAFDGDGVVPYPIPTSLPGAFSPAPNELLTIRGFSLSSGSGSKWSIRIGGMHPVGDWDCYADRKKEIAPGVLVDDKRWPILTLYADSLNWVEIVANCRPVEAGVDPAITFSFLIRVSVDGQVTEYFAGGPNQFWLPDSALYVGFGYDGAGHLSVGLSLGGGEVQTVGGPSDPGIDVNGWLSPAKAITEVWFRGAPPPVPGQPEVGAYRWIGGEVEANAAVPLNNTTLLAAFADPSTFLGVPG